MVPTIPPKALVFAVCLLGGAGPSHLGDSSRGFAEKHLVLHDQATSPGWDLSPAVQGASAVGADRLVWDAGHWGHLGEEQTGRESLQ